MRAEFVALQEYMISKNVNKCCIGIDELPMCEGYCIYDARSVIEVFYFERGASFDMRTFKDITKAIEQFKQLVLADPTTRE